MDVNPIRLLALDDDDLAVISAHVQDAVMAVGDFRYLKGEKRFVIAMNRFDRRVTDSNAQNIIEKGRHLRRRAVLHLDRVLDVKQQNVVNQAKDTILNLMAVTFEETEAPSGFVTLVFSGNAAIRLQVECLECRLGDLDAAWSTPNRPNHGHLPDVSEIDKVLAGAAENAA